MVSDVALGPGCEGMVHVGLHVTVYPLRIPACAKLAGATQLMVIELAVMFVALRDVTALGAGFSETGVETDADAYDGDDDPLTA